MSSFDLEMGPGGLASASQRPGFASIADRAASFASGALGALRDLAAINRARRELWAMDERMLDDIGLTRGQILRPRFHGWKQY